MKLRLAARQEMEFLSAASRLGEPVRNAASEFVRDARSGKMKVETVRRLSKLRAEAPRIYGLNAVEVLPTPIQYYDLLSGLQGKTFDGAPLNDYEIAATTLLLTGELSLEVKERLAALVAPITASGPAGAVALATALGVGSGLHKAYVGLTGGLDCGGLPLENIKLQASASEDNPIDLVLRSFEDCIKVRIPSTVAEYR